MPPLSSQNNRDIRGFFKPFIIPKNRIPQNNVIEDEIIVAPPSRPPSPGDKPRKATASPAKSLNSSRISSVPSNVSTPTKPSPVKQRKQRRTIAQMDGAVNVDETLIHVSPPSSQHRVMAAVAIPAPALPPPPPPPPPQQSKREAPTRTTTTSFSSVSSLTSVPASTQSSSRRIVKDGIQAVTNSDSGSADSDSDELADPSTFVTFKRRKLTPPGGDVDHAIEPSSTVRPTRQSTRLSDQGSKQSSRVGTPRLPPSPPRTVYKHSLLSMVKMAEKQEKTEARITEAETVFKEAQRKREEALERERRTDDGLQAAVADDSDEGERMMLAMRRTEALRDEEKFYYFSGGETRSQREDFPALAVLDEPWAKLLTDEQSRPQACLTGFATELASQGVLPESVLRWFAEELLHESREDLCEAYCQIIAAAPDNAMQALGPPDLCSRYETRSLDAAERLIHLRNEQPIPYGEVSSLPSSLKYYVRVATQICLDQPGYQHWPDLIRELAMVLVDENAKHDVGLQHIVQNCIEQLVNEIDEDFVGDQLDEFQKGINDRDVAKPSAQVQCRLITCLPTTTERCHEFRRRLALRCFTDSQKDFSTSSSGELAERIVTRLKTAPDFSISESTNYAQLGWLIAVLDIAVDGGFGEPKTYSTQSSHVKPTPPLTKPLPSSAEEVRFNARVDTITTQLRLMSSRIRDAGTSHLRRTECKGAIERLVARLEHSVRTKPRPKKGIFGGVTGDQRTFLSGFLKQLDDPKGQREADEVSVLPVDMLSDRHVSFESTVSGAADD